MPFSTLLFFSLHILAVIPHLNIYFVDISQNKCIYNFTRYCYSSLCSGHTISHSLQQCMNVLGSPQPCQQTMLLMKCFSLSLVIFLVLQSLRAASTFICIRVCKAYLFLLVFYSLSFFFLLLLTLKFIYLFIFGCVGSSLLRTSFLQSWRAGATLHCGARASH